MDSPEVTEFKPPYLSFQTFWSFIQELGSKPLPPQIDRSMMDSKSGTDQANLLSTMKSFGLINESQAVTPFLQQIVKIDEIQQKRSLAEVIKLLYPHQLQISAQNGTEKLLYDSFEQDFGFNGDTRRKAVTFFLHAARFSGIDLSPHFPNTRTGSSSPTTSRPRRTPKRKPIAAEPVAAKPSSGTPSGDTYTVELQSGGKVSVVVEVNLFQLNADDRAFVISLVDSLKGYSQSPATDEEDPFA